MDVLRMEFKLCSNRNFESLGLGEPRMSAFQLPLLQGDKQRGAVRTVYTS